jgi:segregation and condensation protein A
MGVTVTFVAILELVREGLIDIVQTEAYAPLHVRSAQGARGLKLAVDNDAQIGAAANEPAAFETGMDASAPDEGLSDDDEDDATDGDTHD